jgi:TonB family protein
MGFSLAASSQDIKYFSKNGILSEQPDSSFYFGKITPGRTGSDTINFFYTDSKKILATQTVKNGLLDGSFQYYYPSGNLMIKGSNKEGEPVGNIEFYYSDGKPKSVINFIPPFDPTQEAENYKILNYWDESGTQIVKEGEGNCKCVFESISVYSNPWDIDRLPNEVKISFWYRNFEAQYLWEGSVKEGLRNAVWKAFKNDVQELEELYANGKFINGIRIDKEKRFEYKSLVENAMPVGGLTEFYKFIGANMNYPREARRKRIEGRVLIEFVLGRDGSITQVKSIMAPHALLADEGVRVVKMAPKWIPGQQRGRPVRQKMVIPLTFKLG